MTKVFYLLLFLSTSTSPQYFHKGMYFTSIEEFGIIICKHFLNEYPEMVNRISVEIIKDRWERISNKDTSGRIVPHKHAFLRKGPNRPFVHVQGTKRYHSNDPIKISMQGGFSDSSDWTPHFPLVRNCPTKGPIARTM